MFRVPSLSNIRMTSQPCRKDPHPWTLKMVFREESLRVRLDLLILDQIRNVGREFQGTQIIVG